MRSTTLSILAPLFPLFVGCVGTPECPELETKDQVIEDTGDINPGDTEIIDDSTDTEDTGDTEIEELVLQMQFTTARSAAEHFQVQAGDTVNFGAWMFSSATGETITVQDITMMSYVDTDNDGVFTAMEEDGINPSDYFTDCKLVDVTSRDVIMGPMELDDRGWVNFTDDFTVGGEYSTALNFTCDLTEAAEEIEFASFAFDIQTMDVYSTADTHQWTGQNVDYVDDGAVPILAAYVDNTTCNFEAVTVGNGRIEVSNELTGSLSSTSPSGASIPGYIEVLRANITSEHEDCDDMMVNFLRLNINSTDNASTNWNDVLEFDAYDLSTDPTTPVMTGEAMLDGTLVSLVGNLEVLAGETITLSVWTDTSGASAVSDDALQLELENMLHIDSVDETIYFMDLGVTGNTLVF